MFHILVIDDDPVIRVLLEQTLRNQGYQVTVAEEGYQGFELAKKLCPALIICDLMMPQMDGLAVCKQVKHHPNLTTTQFILITARAGVEETITGLDQGADDFLAKPIELGELKARVRAALRVHQLTKDLHDQKKNFEAQLAEATEYVRSLLPKPTKEPIQVDVEFIPSMQLGGDCFDYYWLDPDYLVVYLLDAAGHGIGSALLSVSILNMLRSQSLPGVNFYQPSAVLNALNETFQMDQQGDRYFTIWYGVYNRVKQQLMYASAGHPPALLVSGEDPEHLDIKQLATRGTLPIGMFPDIRFHNAYCHVEDNSSLYIFSDGVYEIQQENGQIWGLDALINLLSKFHHQAEFSPKLILEQIKTIHNLSVFDDDFSLIRVSLTE